MGHNGGPPLDEKAEKAAREAFIEVKREDLAGEFDLKVDISTAEVDAAKAQDLAFMLQTMGPTMDFSITKLVLGEITRLKRMPELSHAIMQYEPKPDPLLEELKKLQVEKEKMEIQKLQSEIELNKARALKEETTAEQTALETVEQETGTTHARELEKQVAQSTGNQALAVTQALLKPRKLNETKPDVEAAIGYNELTKVNSDPRTGPTSNMSPAMPPASPSAALSAEEINAMAGPGAMAALPPPPQQGGLPPEMGLPPGGVPMPEAPPLPAPPPV
jgi:hypothetical protein